MRPISLEEAEYVAHRLIVEMMDYDEPVADFKTRYAHRLESCLEQPFQEFDGKQLYPTLSDKAALLFYLVTKNHPFENGNKRMAVMLLLYFLLLNQKWIQATPDGLYKIAIHVAMSEPKDKDTVIEALKRSLNEYCRDFTDDEKVEVTL